MRVCVTCILPFEDMFLTQIRDQVFLLAAFVPVLDYFLVTLHQNVALKEENEE